MSDAPFLRATAYVNTDVVFTETFSGYKAFMRRLDEPSLRGDLVGKPHVIVVEKNGKPFFNLSLPVPASE